MEKTALYDLRRAKRMTQEQLAQAIGVTHQQIRNYEVGKNPLSVKRAKQIADVLNIDWTKLYEIPEV